VTLEWHVGSLAAAIGFFVVILAIGALFTRFRGAAVPLFWSAYVISRPLAGSLSDWLIHDEGLEPARSHSRGGRCVRCGVSHAGEGTEQGELFATYRHHDAGIDTLVLIYRTRPGGKSARSSPSPVALCTRVTAPTSAPAPSPVENPVPRRVLPGDGNALPCVSIDRHPGRCSRLRTICVRHLRNVQPSSSVDKGGSRQR